MCPAVPAGELTVGFLQELKRKSVHLSSISIPVLYNWIPSETFSKWLVLGATSIFLGTDLLKLRNRRFYRLFMSVLGRLLRVHETRELVGSTYVMLAATATIFCFSKPVAMAAMGFLVLGDTAAALFGKTYGRLRYLGKSVEGSLACFLACMVVAALVPGLSLEVGLAGAAVATIAELVPVPVDDNFRIPFASATVMELMIL